MYLSRMTEAEKRKYELEEKAKVDAALKRQKEHEEEEKRKLTM